VTATLLYLFSKLKLATKLASVFDKRKQNYPAAPESKDNKNQHAT
jgi:hypothetical protein